MFCHLFCYIKDVNIGIFDCNKLIGFFFICLLIKSRIPFIREFEKGVSLSCTYQFLLTN